MGVHHPERPGRGRTLRLEPDAGSPTGDHLAARYELSDDDHARINRREGLFVRALLSLVAIPVKRIRPPMGASIHYAGTLPFAADARPLSVSPDGRLAGTRGVWVADGCGFRFLPAKGLTLSLMAYAHLVGQNAVADV